LKVAGGIGVVETGSASCAIAGQRMKLISAATSAVVVENESRLKKGALVTTPRQVLSYHCELKGAAECNGHEHFMSFFNNLIYPPT